MPVFINANNYRIVGKKKQQQKLDLDLDRLHYKPEYLQIQFRFRQLYNTKNSDYISN